MYEKLLCKCEIKLKKKMIEWYSFKNRSNSFWKQMHDFFETDGVLSNIFI